MEPTTYIMLIIICPILSIEIIINIIYIGILIISIVSPELLIISDTDTNTRNKKKNIEENINYIDKIKIFMMIIELYYEY